MKREETVLHLNSLWRAYPGYQDETPPCCRNVTVILKLTSCLRLKFCSPPLYLDHHFKIIHSANLIIAPNPLISKGHISHFSKSPRRTRDLLMLKQLHLGGIPKLSEHLKYFRKYRDWEIPISSVSRSILRAARSTSQTALEHAVQTPHVIRRSHKSCLLDRVFCPSH